MLVTIHVYGRHQSHKSMYTNRQSALAAVALMPVMGMAQDNNERDYAWERQMRSQQYADSVKAAQQKADALEQFFNQLFHKMMLLYTTYGSISSHKSVLVVVFITLHTIGHPKGWLCWYLRGRGVSRDLL